MTDKDRLDKALARRESGLSRNKAQQLIISGQVKVNGTVETDVAHLVSEDVVIELLSRPQFVSRGGEKLAGALQQFHLSVRDKICLDVGASTGGFTDCLLQCGAKKVYALDVGEGQLVDKIKSDPRVVAFEKTHVKQLPSLVLEPLPSLIVIDVSFISLKKVLPFILGILQNSPFEIIALVKPQFEFGDYVSHKNFDKLTPADIDSVLEQLEHDIQTLCQPYIIQNRCLSPITGTDGTQEYFFHIAKPA